MRIRIGFIILFASLIVALGLLPRHTTAGEKKMEPKVRTALIVVGGGPNPVKAFRVHNEKKLATLEGFFPGFRQSPRSNRAGAWDIGYEVFFMFEDRSIVRVKVSPSENEPAWSTGHGDFDFKGDMRRFIAELDGAKEVEIDKSRPTLP